MKRLKVLVLSFGLVCGVVSIANADLNTGLVAYYPFSGNANDESGNGNHGIVHDAMLTNDRNKNPNSAYSFSVGNWIEIPDDDSIDLQDAFTISVWFKLEGVYSTFMCLIGKDYTTAYAMGLGAGGPGDCPAPEGTERWMNILINDVNTWYTAHHFTCGTWYHVAVTFDDASDNIQMFINGVHAGTKWNRESLSANSYPLGIGRDGRYGDQFIGIIDDIRIYNRALSEAEINILSRNISLPFIPSLLLDE